MTLKIPKVLVFTVIGLTLYILVNKLFPEKFTTSKKYPLTHLRHGNIEYRYIKSNFAKEFLEKKRS